MATKPKFYVIVVRDCPDCDGQGGANAGPPCPSCQGTGTMEDAAELAEALAMIGILPRLEQVERTASRAAYETSAMLNGGI